MKKIFTIISMLTCLTSIQPTAAKDFHATPETFTGVRNEFLSYIQSLPNEATETVTLYLAGGLYKFNTDDEIYIHFYIKPNVSVRITAETGAVVNIISDGGEYKKADAVVAPTTWPNHYYVKRTSKFTRGEVFVDQNFNPVPISDSGILNAEKHIHQAEAPIEELGGFSRRLKLPAELSATLEGKNADFFKNSLIWWHMWSGSHYGTINKAENGYLYFNAAGGSELDFVYDREGSYEQFYITNVTAVPNRPDDGKIWVVEDGSEYGGMYVPNTVSTLYECKHQNLAWTQDDGASYKELKLSNLNFVGAANFDYERYGEQNAAPTGLTYYRESLLSLSNIDNVAVENCTFRNIGSLYCINSETATVNYEQMGATNFTVKGCKAFDLGGGFANTTAGNSVVSGNTIHDIAKFGAMNYAIRAGGPNNKVENNIIYNFPYIGIYAGSTANSYEHNVSVRVQQNELYMTPAFRNYLYRNTIDDGGAIYFYTHHDGSECIGNVVHDISSFGTYAGGADINHRSGIMGDDGAYRVKVSGNLVFNVTDRPVCFWWNNQYADAQDDPFYICSDNDLRGNVLFGAYQIQGNDNVLDTHPNLVGTNYLAKDINGSTAVFGAYYNTDTNNSKVVAEDITDDNAKIANGKVYLTKDYSALGLSDFVKQWIVDASTLQNITLSENEIYTPVTADKQANITLLRTLKTTWSTLCLPFDMTSEQITSTFGADAQVASYANQEGNTLNFSTSTRAIKAHTPCLIKVGTENGTWNISHATLKTGGAGSAQPIGATLALKGIYSPGYVPQNAYFISNNKFYQVETAGSTTIKAFRAYIETASSGAKELQIKIDGEATAIDDIAADKPSTFDVYTTGGSIVRKNASTLNGLPKGIYVLKMADGTSKKQIIN